VKEMHLFDIGVNIHMHEHTRIRPQLYRRWDHEQMLLGNRLNTTSNPIKIMKSEKFAIVAQGLIKSTTQNV
jgi:hypothetical protein